MVLSPFAETKGPRPPGRNPVDECIDGSHQCKLGQHTVRKRLVLDPSSGYTFPETFSPLSQELYCGHLCRWRYSGLFFIATDPD